MRSSELVAKRRRRRVERLDPFSASNNRQRRYYTCVAVVNLMNKGRDCIEGLRDQISFSFKVLNLPYMKEIRYKVMDDMMGVRVRTRWTRG